LKGPIWGKNGVSKVTLAKRGGDSKGCGEKRLKTRISMVTYKKHFFRHYRGRGSEKGTIYTERGDKKMRKKQLQFSKE